MENSVRRFGGRKIGVSNETRDAGARCWVTWRRLEFVNVARIKDIVMKCNLVHDILSQIFEV